MFLHPAQIELFDHDDEEGDSDPDFMGHLIFEGIGGSFLQELAAAHDGGDEHGGSEVLGKQATHHCVTLSSI